MKITSLNWMQVENYLKQNDLAVLPLGSTEQHAYLSLCVDAILSEKVAADAAEPLGIPVFPVQPYGLAPYFMSYPGTISLKMRTYLSLLEDILNSLAHHGFRRLLIVNGHGGNSPAQGFVTEWLGQRPEMQVKWHDWWRAPQTWAKVQKIDPVASHASWLENFPWTRLPDVELPDEQVNLPARDGMAILDAPTARAYYGTGNFAGVYQKTDEEMLALWETAVAETRALLTDNWR